MKSFLASAVLAAISAANSVPIFGTYPGWVEGGDAKKIQIELFEDYLCGDCLRFNPVFEQLLDTEWLGGTVRDQVGVGLTPFPLPYHVHAYQVNQLVGYFMGLCAAGKECYSNEYKDFAFENQSTILGKHNVSQDDFKTWWGGEVAKKFKLDESEVAANYADDPYNTDANQRAFLKYAWAKGVNATPTAFVNGVKLDSVPMTVDGWLDILNGVYNSQFGVAGQAKFLQN